MDLKLVSYNLGIIALLFACAMVFSMIWALPFLGGIWAYEARGVAGLSLSILASGAVSALLISYGKSAKGHPIYSREAIAIVGLGWIMASILGALPYLFSGTCSDVGVKMTVADALFESVSGITTTGSTVLSQLEDPSVISRCILFWRSTTHFVGGLGIIVLLISLLDTGLAGKLMLRHEMTGPKQVQGAARSKILVRRIMIVYLVLNVILIILFCICGMSVYDSLCHSFGIVATGGLGTYNNSFMHFREVLPVANYTALEWIAATAMFVSGMNFMGLFLLATGYWRRLVGSTEWRIYVAIVLLFSLTIAHYQAPLDKSVAETIRDSFFQVSSLISSAGYATIDYCAWLPFPQALLMFLMFVSACSGSTAGGPKIVRYILLFKLLHIELEKVYRPTIVRPLYYSGERITDPALTSGIFLHFVLLGVTLALGWMVLMFFEATFQPAIWNGNVRPMSSDLFSAVVSQYSNVGPGLGEFGPLSNYGSLCSASKYTLLTIMLLGRLDFFAILLLFSPAFWKK